jgi:PAS domain S-box-containing protein
MSRTLRLLMIEDSEDDAALLMRELRRAGYELMTKRVDTAGDLDEALNSSWDLILCDYRMPNLDAPTALSVVSARQVQTPCIIVSGTVGEERAVNALRLGAKDFVLKSNLSRLVSAVERELRDSEVRIKHALAEQTLRATEASFRAAFELIPDGILVCRDGRVIHANGPAAKMLAAVSQDELQHSSFVELFLAADQPAVSERLRETLDSTTPVPFGELTMVRLDGRPIAVETTATSVHFDGQSAVLGVLRDVSARRELIARTMQVDRMLAVGTLAAGVGHEINNPLAYVMANVAYATDEISRAQQQLEKLSVREPTTGTVAAALSEVVGILAEVDEGTRRIRDIARDLSTFARNDEELRLIDLRAVADSALRMATPEIRQRARVVRHYDEIPQVRASVSRLSQVLLNLVVNAAHAIPKGAHDTNEIGVNIRSEGGNVVVEIVDTGSGIAPEHRDRLFTPFFTTKPVGQGTGLGLAISRRIVRSLGGDIQLESAQGRGTTARVVLPAAREPTPDGTSKPAPPPRRARLLFIDDERLVGAAFQRSLSREHDIVVVETTADALARLRGGESFDAIFCDINMPSMTGVELYAAIERSSPQVAARVVMITGGTDDLDAKDFLAAHSVPLLEKPLDMSQVRALLAEMLVR